MDKVTVSEEELYEAIDECVLMVIKDLASNKGFKGYEREQNLCIQSCTLVRKGLERFNLWQRLKKHMQA